MNEKNYYEENADLLEEYNPFTSSYKEEIARDLERLNALTLDKLEAYRVNVRAKYPILNLNY